MKKILLICLVMALLVQSVSAFPTLLDQQGVLRNSTDGSLIEGAHTFNISLYNITSGAQIYSEQKSLTLANGIWNYIIGVTNAITPGIFKSDLSVITQVDGENMTEVNLTAVPYAFYSLNTNDTDFLGGTAAASYALDSEVTALNGTWQDNSDNLTADDIVAFGFINDSNTSNWDKDSTDDATFVSLLAHGYINSTNTSWANTLIDNWVTQAFVQALSFYTQTELYNKTQIDNLNGTWQDQDTTYSNTSFDLSKISVTDNINMGGFNITNTDKISQHNTSFGMCWNGSDTIIGWIEGAC